MQNKEEYIVWFQQNLVFNALYILLCEYPVAVYFQKFVILKYFSEYIYTEKCAIKNCSETLSPGHLSHYKK